MQNISEGPAKTHSSLAFRRGFSMIPCLKVTRKPVCLTEMRLDRLNDQEEHQNHERLDFELSIPGSPLVPIRDIHIDLPSYLEDIPTHETTLIITNIQESDFNDDRVLRKRNFFSEANIREKQDTMQVEKRKFVKCLRQEARSQAKVMGKENDLQRFEKVAETHMKRRCIQHRKIEKKEASACNKRTIDLNKSFSEETCHQDYLV